MNIKLSIEREGVVRGIPITRRTARAAYIRSSKERKSLKIVV